MSVIDYDLHQARIQSEMKSSADQVKTDTENRPATANRQKDSFALSLTSSLLQIIHFHNL